MSCDPVRCLNEGCDRTWPRDPVLEVDCPSCRQPKGQRCKRPSGHGVWGDHGRFCDARDIAADQAGAYGRCPFGICGLTNTSAGGVPHRQLSLI